jgi:hypothetical protein
VAAEPGNDSIKQGAIMGLRATGTFQLGWDEKSPYDTAEGATLAMVTATHEFQGDIDGSGVVELIKAMTPMPTSAGYVGMERVIGSVNGRAGSFVLQHSAISDRGDRMLNVVVVPDTGTGELTGISGRLDIEVAPDGTHKYILDYALDGMS